jgi:peroxiredoxin
VLFPTLTLTAAPGTVPVAALPKEFIMIRLLGLAVVLGLSLSVVHAEDLKSGPGDKIGGAFNVKAITGEKAGKTLCYVCQYNAEARPAVVLVFTQKADEDLAKLVKAVDEVQKNNAKLGTVVVGVSGVAAADFEKLQSTHKLTTPLVVAEDKDGPEKYKLNKDAAVTVLVYKKGGDVTKTFAFKDTKSAAEKAKDIASAASEAVK